MREPVRHLVKSLKEGSFLSYWCGLAFKFGHAWKGAPEVVFQEEFATCSRCRGEFTRAVTTGRFEMPPPPTPPRPSAPVEFREAWQSGAPSKRPEAPPVVFSSLEVTPAQEPS